MTHMENACESVDACVFSGDSLLDPVQRNQLKEYIARWQRAIAQHEMAEEPTT